MRPSPPVRAARAVAVLCALLAASAASGDIKVEIEGVSGPVKENVLAYLSLNRYSTQSNVDENVVYRLQQRADSETREALEPFGYYEPTVTSALRKEGANWISHLTITPGPPTVLTEADVRIDGPGGADPQLEQVLRDAPLTAGSQLSHPAYDRLKSELMRRALSRGYLDARWTASDLYIDPPKREARARLRLETGQRYKFGAVSIDQHTIDPDLMRRFLRFKQGDWFDSSDLLRTQFALDDSAYFGNVEVLPGDRDPVTLSIPITIRATGTQRNKFTFGVGYSTDQQWRLTGTWDNRLLNEDGHRFRVDIVVGTSAQSYGFTYTIPVGDPALEKLEFSSTQAYSSPGDVHSIATVLHAGLTQVAGRWQYVPSIDLVHATSLIDNANIIENLVVPGITLAQIPRGFMSNSPDQSSIIGSTPGSVSTPVGMSTAAADATGLYAQLIGASGAVHSDVTFAQLHVRDQWLFTLAPKWRLVTRAEAGVTIVHDFAQLPVYYRFFAGGDQSVRGYAYQSLSPTDSQGQKSGGKDLFVMSAEIDRDVYRNFAVAVFCDGGNALMRFSDPLAYGAGVGLRYRLPFLSMGFDIAKPLSLGGGSPRLNINISPVF